MLRFVEGLDGNSLREELAPEGLYNWDLYRLGVDPASTNCLWVLVWKFGHRADAKIIQRFKSGFENALLLMSEHHVHTLTFTSSSDTHVRTINAKIKEIIGERLT
ncbi:MAG TPA: hypothetical protein VLG69_03360 [Candidatus Andersenbacteria bacterium]|nr:hypothetical protein [Candidatus Andersenbacteria bacterium]